MKLHSVKLGNSVRVSSRLESTFLDADKNKVEMTIEDKLFIHIVDLLRPDELPIDTTIMNMVYCVKAPAVKEEPKPIKRTIVKLKPDSATA